MANKKNWLGILVIVLVFGMMVVGCSNGTTDGDGTTGGGSDVWTNVTSLSQLNGTWKTQSTVTGNMEGIKVTQNYSNYTLTFNSVTKTMSVSGTIKMTLSGGNISEFWSDMKEGLEFMNQQDGVTVSANDANHTITMTFNNFSQSVDDDYIQEMGFQINQNGTKLKVIEDGHEIIYTKQ
jgi:hypothetical protein